MKKAMIAVALAVMAAGGAMASGYPNNYMNQSAVAAVNGPAVLAEVSTVQAGQKYVIAYKGSGMLAGKAGEVNAYLKVHYKLIPFNSSLGGVIPGTAEKQIKLMPEWHGAGYISGELSQNSSWGNDGLVQLPAQAVTYNRLQIESVELAFNAAGQWDSVYGKNYVIVMDNLYRSGERFQSAEASQNIANDVWNFIVGLMRR
ncbi:MAG: hypothetical protein M0011_00110 [Elusimicrobia bacterium]|nr:hypothetical protein [Elusimicrobiota bacterium]